MDLLILQKHNRRMALTAIPLISYVSLCDSSAKSRRQCLISSRDAAHCADGGCDLWYSGSSTVWVALFYGFGRMGGKTVRTSWENHEKVIILQLYVLTYNQKCGMIAMLKG